ncbi:hypothetical protein L1887_11412 [Cichorium endivia]|nr:hypothetical protein L1887_11412 [Cichorium endivia]
MKKTEESNTPSGSRGSRGDGSNSGNQQPSQMMKSDVAGVDQYPKRSRQDHQRHRHIHAGGSSAVLPTAHDLHNSSSDGIHFPALMSSPAVFQCVRISGVDETNEQLAYQTAVSVGGHVFNGILYDHGPDPGLYNNHVRESSSAAAATHQDVNLVRLGTTATNSTTTTSIYPHVTIIDPSSMYPNPLCAFVASTQLFPPPRC